MGKENSALLSTLQPSCFMYKGEKRKHSYGFKISGNGLETL